MRIFKMLLAAARGLLLAAALASLAYGAASIFLLSAINDALRSLPEGVGRGVALFAVLALVMVLAQTTASVLFMRLSQRTQANLRWYIFQRVTSAPYRRVEEVGEGRVQALLADDTANVSAFFVGMPVLIGNTVTVLGGLSYLAWLSPQTFLIACAVLAVGVAGYHLNHRKVLRYLRQAGDDQDRLFRRFQSMSAGGKELKLNRDKCATFEQETASAIEAVRHNRAMGLSLFSVSASWGRFMFFVLIGFTLFYPAYAGAFDPTVATGYVLVFLYIMAPLENLLNNIPLFNNAKVSAARIEKLADELVNTESPAHRDWPAAEVRLTNVTHSYFREREEDLFTLGPINLRLRAGEVVFLVGGNGSGKTTLAKLLVGLYVPEGGQVAMDDVPIDDGNRDAYRQCYSAVFSDFHLFDSLIGLPPEGLDAKANEWLRKLHLDHKVTVSDGAFSTRALSQGQRKRLALVAACLEDRPFLLFDEWAADQDPTFKEVFYRDVLAELRARGKGVVVISHDDRYFALGDRIIRMENGQIVQSADVADRAPERAPAEAALLGELSA